jgi:hypothetical protein
MMLVANRPGSKRLRAGGTDAAASVNGPPSRTAAGKRG